MISNSKSKIFAPSLRKEHRYLALNYNKNLNMAKALIQDPFALPYLLRVKVLNNIIPGFCEEQS